MQLEKIQYNQPKVPELVMQSLIAAIDKGDISVGGELPSERDLAETLGVGGNAWRFWNSWERWKTGETGKL